MTRNALLFTAALVAASLAIPVLHAADAPPDNTPPAPRQAGPVDDQGPRQGPPSPFANQLEQMDRALNLTDEQKPKIKEELDALNKEFEEFRSNAMDKMRDVVAAARGQDADPQQARQQLQDLRKNLNDSFQKIVSTHKTRINAVLTDDQRVTWETIKLNQAIQQRLGPAELTDDQRQQIRQLVSDAGKDLASAKDASASAAITGKVVKKIVADILTEEQAANLVAFPALPMVGVRLGGPGPGPRGPGDAPPRPNNPP